MTNGCAPAPWTNNPGILPPQSVIGGGSQLLRGVKHRDQGVFCTNMWFFFLYFNYSWTSFTSVLQSVCSDRQFSQEGPMASNNRRRLFTTFQLWWESYLSFYLYLHSSCGWRFVRALLCVPLPVSFRCVCTDVQCNIFIPSRIPKMRYFPSSILPLFLDHPHPHQPWTCECVSPPNVPSLLLWFWVWTFSSILCSDPWQTGFFLGFKWFPTYVKRHILFHFCL